MRLILFSYSFLLLMFFHGETQAQAMDTTVIHIEKHQFDTETLASYRSDEDYNYKMPGNNRRNIIAILFDKLLNFFFQIFGNQFFAMLTLIILIIIGVVGLGFAIYGLFGLGKTIPIYSEDKGKLGYSVHEESIELINFPEEIDKAIAQADYRRAIRLVYLYTLRMLAEAKFLSLQPHKTNHDYIMELRNEIQKAYFQEILIYFEYVWYGDFKAEKNQCDSMLEVFGRMKKTIIP